MPTSRDLAIFVQTMTTTTIALRCGWSAGNSTRNFMLGVPVPVQSNSMLGTVLEAGKLRVPIPDSHAFASWYHIGMVVYDQLSGDGSNLIPSLQSLVGGEREPGYKAKMAVAGEGSGPTFCVGDCFQSFSKLELRGKAAGL